MADYSKPGGTNPDREFNPFDPRQRGDSSVPPRAADSSSGAPRTGSSWLNALVDNDEPAHQTPVAPLSPPRATDWLGAIADRDDDDDEPGLLTRAKNAVETRFMPPRQSEPAAAEPARTAARLPQKSDWLGTLADPDERRGHESGPAPRPGAESPEAAVAARSARWPMRAWVTVAVLGALAVIEAGALVIQMASRPDADLTIRHETLRPPADSPTPGWHNSAATAPPEIVVAAEGGPGPTTLARALEIAPAGAIIKLKPGTYHEKIVLEKPVDIVGDGASGKIVLESDTASVVVMKTDRASLRGLTLVRKAGVAEEHAHAIDVPQGRLIVDDCVISSEAGDAVHVHGAGADPVFRRCTIPGGMGGFAFSDGARGLVDDCTVKGGSSSSLKLESGAKPVFAACKIFEAKAKPQEKPAPVTITAANATFEQCDFTAKTAIAAATEPGRWNSYALIAVNDCSPRFFGCAGGRAAQRVDGYHRHGTSSGPGT